ncbi:hypothetical protein [Streptomyces sp. NPDC047315]|uniref:hypothetical protein n=1 Tax=Streptomyces sp. NPDC047315 TaxID=3155142 RepID=UPI0033CAC99E
MGEVFEAAYGDEVAEGPRTAPDQRATEVRAAYAGLRQIRQVTGAVPAAWERNQPARAVAITLEAAGFAPSALDATTGARSATGYRVAPGERPGVVRVDWLGAPGSGAATETEERLRECAGVLEEAGGWEVLAYRAGRGRWFLEVEVRMAPRGGR